MDWTFGSRGFFIVVTMCVYGGFSSSAVIEAKHSDWFAQIRLFASLV